MHNFTLIIKIFVFTSCLCFGFVKAGAQCNSAFEYAVSTLDRQATISLKADDSSVNKHHQWISDGIPMGVGPALTFYYFQPGEHTITHILSDSLNGCFDSTVHIININFGNACYAHFYANTRDSAIMGSAILYADPTVYGGAVTNYIWSVNGTVVDSSNSPAYRLTQPGADYTCLTITTDSGCTSQYCMWSQVFTKCDLSVSYTYTVDSLNPATVKFNSNPSGYGFWYEWKIGSQSMDHQHFYRGSPTVQYAQSGTYPVSLYVFDSTKVCFDSTGGTFTVPPFPCDTFHLSYKYNFAPGDSSLVYFRAQSNQPLTSQNWVIRSLYDSSAYVNLSTLNPSYNFNDTGHYMVCLIAQSAMGCNNTFCDIIYASSKHGKPGNLVTSYPNPAKDAVSFTVPLAIAGKVIINVYNQAGTKVYTMQMQAVNGNNQIKIPVWQLQPGQYFIEITNGKERKRSVFQKL